MPKFRVHINAAIDYVEEVEAENAEEAEDNARCMLDEQGAYGSATIEVEEIKD